MSNLENQRLVHELNKRANCAMPRNSSRNPPAFRRLAQEALALELRQP